MKFYVSSVSLFKICASIIYNMKKRARRAPYFRQRFYLITQYVSCRYGSYRFSERCFCTKICDFHKYHARTPLKRMYGALRMFCAKVERKLSVTSKSAWISSKTARFSEKYVMEYYAPHFVCSVVQRPHIAYLYCKEKSKPCPMFPTAIASDHSIYAVCDSNSLGLGFLRGGTKMYFHVQSDLCLRAAPVWREQSADSSLIRISVHDSTDTL